MGYSRKNGNYQLFYELGDNNEIDDYNQSYYIFLLQNFCENANLFIIHYPAPVSFKQILRDKFEQWIRALARELLIPDEQVIDILQDLCVQIKRNVTEEIVKALHDREGVTKDELVDKLGVTSRTINNELAKIGGKAKEPARLFGQHVQLKISSWSEYNETNHPTVKHYCTKNTLHPIAMQLNVSQVGTMLSALAHSYYDDERSIAHGLGMDVWCQLSDYGKERVRLIYASEDEDLADFLDELDDECELHEFTKFHTEAEVYEDLNEDEQRVYHIKRRRI